MEEMVSRRGLFGALAREGGRLAVGLLDGVGEAARTFEREARPKAPPLRGWVRPPNALPEAAFLAACTRCDDCVKACPHFVLRKAGPECGPASGTPVVIPRENPCLLCEGLPCAAACGTGALTKPVPGARARLGLARVSASACYMAQGQPCDYCVKACPELPKAIRADARGAAAAVDAVACTGCGRCVQICPTEAITTEVRLS